MKLIAIKSGIKSFAVKSCRWSIGASLLLYSILFGSIMIFQIPLKSDDKMEKTTFYNDSPREQNNILEYLHKLHNLKGNQEIRVGEREIIQPFYTVEEVFRK